MPERPFSSMMRPRSRRNIAIVITIRKMAAPAVGTSCSMRYSRQDWPETFTSTSAPGDLTWVVPVTSPSR